MDQVSAVLTVTRQKLQYCRLIKTILNNTANQFRVMQLSLAKLNNKSPTYIKSDFTTSLYSETPSESTPVIHRLRASW